MATATVYPNAPELSTDDYVAVGLATCFVKEEGEVLQVQVIEAIPSAALEAIVKGIPTSYQMAWGTTLGAVLDGESPKRLPEFPPSAEFSEEFGFRAIAAARTYKIRPQAQSHIPLGTVRSDFTYSLERKRVLNPLRVVSTEDNVKQHSHTHKVL
ncbi:MAG: hypothetical protein EAZ09_23555 [Oscillatoriales cyanobacterium]|nr:MAG: hypothetical protein EAZ18_20095 [Oscillatoriales cyanobacterium]TAH15673.1 MAG: hypothetical protein EAZ09_23555 [Oscillatoriales cyanobacterium]